MARAPLMTTRIFMIALPAAATGFLGSGRFHAERMNEQIG